MNSSTKVMIKLPVDAEKVIISSLETFIQRESKALRQSFSNIDDVKNGGTLSESKLLVVELAEDYGTEDGVTIQFVSDELIEKASKIKTSVRLLSKKTHNGHVIKTKVIFGTTPNFDHFIEISIPKPVHSRSVVRGSSNTADLTVTSPDPSRFINPMNFSALINCIRTEWLWKSVLSGEIQISALNLVKDVDIEDSNQSSEALMRGLKHEQDDKDCKDQPAACVDFRNNQSELSNKLLMSQM